MGLFNRRFRWSVRDTNPVSPPVRVQPWDYNPDDLFHQAWEKKRLPGPGTGPYAYESLALPQFTPVGTGVGIDQQIVPLEQPLYAYQSVPFQGIPIVAGTFQLQPLFDPGSGYVGPIDPLKIPAGIILNQANLEPNPVATNAVT